MIPSDRPSGGPALARRPLIVACVVLAVLLGVVATAAAASGVVSAAPPPGASVGSVSGLRMEFTAPVEARFAVLELWAHGRPVSLPARVEAGDTQVVVAAVPRVVIAPGGAWVRYRVLTGDGHVVTGRYPVEVGHGGPASAPPARLGSGSGAWIAGLGRGLVLAGLIVAVGVVVLRWGVAGPAWREGGVVGPGNPDDRAEFRSRAATSLVRGGGAWWTAWWWALAAGTAGVVLYGLGLVVWLGSGAGIGPLLADTRTGRALAVLVVCLMAAAAAGWAMHRGGDPRAPDPRLAWGIALGIWAVIGICTMSWQGHASDGTDASVNILADAVHSLATAAWIGGLVGLLVLVVTPSRLLGSGDRVRLLAGAVVRFSTLAIACVTLLVITGTYRALAELGSLAQLTGTAYGIALVVKLAIFAVMLAAGGYARIVLHPRLERAAVGLDPDDRGAGGALRSSLRVELALAAVLMAVVAVLVALTPPG
jgi:copper transport protein